MNKLVSGEITPWLLGGLLLLVLLTLIITIKSWREAKRSPYFFLRRQAAHRMQQYGLTTLGLLTLSVLAAVYTWQTPVDNTPRYALLTNTKPIVVAEEERGAAPTAGADEAPAAIKVELGPGGDEAASDLTTVNPGGQSLGAGLEQPAATQTAPALPTEFDQYEPAAQLNDATSLTPILFSTNVDGQYNPISPRLVYSEGYFTLYATFGYQSMADGMAWAWIWRRDGQVISGGNELWAYGEAGPGYVYLRPEEGFAPGDYTLQVWVNSQLQQQASVTVTTSAASR